MWKRKKPEEGVALICIRTSRHEIKRFTCELLVVPLQMEIDTGAEVSVISDATPFPDKSHISSSVVRKTYTDQLILVVG